MAIKGDDDEDDDDDEDGNIDSCEEDEANSNGSKSMSDDEVGDISSDEWEYLFEEYLLGASEIERDALLHVPKVAPLYSNSSYPIFSSEQLTLLRIQMQQNLQLVSQAYVMVKELRGDLADDTNFWRRQLKQLDGNRESAIQFVGCGSFHHSPAAPYISQILQPPPPETKNTYLSREFRRSYNYQLSLKEKKDWEIRLSKDEKGKRQPRPQRMYPAPIFERLAAVIQMGGCAFDSSLIPNIIKVRKGRGAEFVGQEDALLVRGMIAFGCNSLETIRAFCLPPKSVEEIEARVDGLANRSNPNNSLKTIYLRPFKPFTLIERDILREVSMAVIIKLTD
ncbi:hypothetical protein HDU97_000150 [Phlyctochytrium planicorne]|nr:hypothetical protein HDU97_000150 [Phlyctochytrium planicorne]